ncbi:UV DNA damage repair endonuclease UvsE, partial [Clostridium paraputrificum]
MKIGYACTPLSTPLRTTRKFTLNSYNEETLKTTISDNLLDLYKILEFNNKLGIKLFRISSDIIPFGSHSINTFNWSKYFSNELKSIGEFIKNNNLRVSMHPGQYTVLNSPKDEIVNKAIDDLNYHTSLLDSMGLNSEHKIILHVGGVYDSKVESTERFMNNYTLLSKSIKNRLIIENDEKNYSFINVLNICKAINAPMVFDNLHNECFGDNNYTLDKLFELAKSTWSNEKCNMKVHYSQQDTKKKKGSHSPTIFTDDFLKYYSVAKNYNLDIMLEVKDKDFSAIKTINLIKESQNALTEVDRLMEIERYKLYLIEKGEDILKKAKDLILFSDIKDFYLYIDNLYYKEPTSASTNKALVEG